MTDLSTYWETKGRQFQIAEPVTHFLPLQILVSGQGRFESAYRHLCDHILNQPLTHTGEWQAMDTSASSMHQTWEIEDATLQLDMPMTMGGAATEIGPDLPWAEDHFQERVSRIPYNPAPSHEWWPHGTRKNAAHITAGVFAHTYPERFWPRRAVSGVPFTPDGPDWAVMEGIRYEYGDLDDVVRILVRNPGTRQAYLPVWFPEDLHAAAELRERVPCTLGYHFRIDAKGHLNVNYYMRSCDLYRHFRNDVYMAVRLAQWVCDEFNEKARTMAANGEISPMPTVVPGRLRMHMASLHAFKGDEEKLKAVIRGDIHLP